MPTDSQIPRPRLRRVRIPGTVAAPTPCRRSQRNQEQSDGRSALGAPGSAGL